MGDVKGIVGEKVGMTQIFDETRAVPVTVIKAGPCVVAQVRSQGTDGYDAVQLAYGQMRPRDINRPTKGHFDKAGTEALRHLVELRTDDAATYTPGHGYGPTSSRRETRWTSSGCRKARGSRA
jgi:large subunit ribosomal protein L3